MHARFSARMPLADGVIARFRLPVGVVGAGGT